jgi:beta-1,4-mannosyltransferase
MKIISVPTEKFRFQNPIFHLFYAEMKKQGVEAGDFRFKDLFARDLAIFQVHFPEHFAMNYAPASAFLRSCGLLAAMLICKLRGVRTVWTVHNVDPFEKRNMLLYKVLMRVFVRLVDGCVFLSSSSEQQFKLQFPWAQPKLAALIPHPAYPVRVIAEPTGETVIVGMVGEQKTYKQPLQSLRLFETAHRLVNAHLLVAGKVHDAETFRQAFSALPADHVRWIDRRLDDEELERSTGQVHFVLLPYSMITNSGAAIYALSCERAIIASPLLLFYELRELFGPKWVRIADGAENEASFWTKPTLGDREALKRRLETIGIGVTAGRHVEFFKRLRGLSPISQGRREDSPLKKRRPAA